MLTTTTVLAIVAAATAQEITSAEGDLTILTRRQTSVENIASQVDGMPALIDTKIAQAQATMTDTAWRATLNATVQMTSMISELQSQLAQVRAENAAAQSAMAAQLAQFASEQQAAAEGAAADIARQQAAMVDTVQQQLTAAGRTQNETMAQLTASVDQQVARMNATLTVSLANKAPAKKHIFISYCPNHLYGHGWRTTCLNGVVTDTLAPYGAKQDNTWVRANMRGFFRISHTGMGYSCNWNHARIRSRIGGREFDLDYGHLYSHSHWTDHARDLTWLAVPQQMFTISVYGQCGHISQHAGGREGSHQRFSFEYVGTAV